MVPGQKVEFIILPLSAILTLGWDLKEDVSDDGCHFKDLTCKKVLSFIILTNIRLFQIPGKDKDG